MVVGDTGKWLGVLTELTTHLIHLISEDYLKGQ
jgi:hypothetical protein